MIFIWMISAVILAFLAAFIIFYTKNEEEECKKGHKNKKRKNFKVVL